LSWPILLEKYGHLGGFGEVRSSEDWLKLPRDEPVRVVALSDAHGGVIRWATDTAVGLGGLTHEHLVFADDAVDDARSGYVIVTADGHVRAG
jgi:hypothetical protein